MLVHFMGAGQERAEIVSADGDHDRQADRRPERIAAADPVPEAEDPIRRDAEGRDLVEGRRYGGEVFAHRVGSQCRRQPFARGLGIGHRLDGGEGFRSDDEQRRFGVEPLQRVMHVRAVDIGNVVRARAVMVRRQRQRRHDRAEIGTADADVDDVGYLPARRAGRAAVAHRVGKAP